MRGVLKLEHFDKAMKLLENGFLLTES